MSKENNEIDISFENENVVSEDTVVPGNVLGEDDNIISNDDIQGPIIVNTDDSVNDEEMSGPIIVNNENTETQVVEQSNNVESSVTFRELEAEIKELNDEKEEVERNIESLNKRKSELEVLIRSKQEELDYKREVEVTTDRLKTYIKDLEVKPGAVRDALSALINNMDN